MNNWKSDNIPENLKKELKKIHAVTGHNDVMSGYWTYGKEHNAQSSFFEPYAIGDHGLSNIRTISRARYGSIQPRTLRAVAEKAWIINVCINHVIKKLKPYFKPVSDNNKRGFQLLKDGSVIKDSKGRKSKEKNDLEKFLLKTGNYQDSTRDNFVKYCTKIIRDLLTMDQIATELQYDKGGKVCAFFAVDAATIERVLPDPNIETEIKFLQIIDGTPAAGYTDNEMLFDFENPRTDIYHSFYGYSYVEQAVDLITAQINAFVYNSGNFTENKLPRGMLLIEGDSSQETIEQMEDYIAEIMSGSPVNQWRIPIIPSGMAKGEGGGIKWQELNGKNRDMEFSNWQDYLTSGVVALFGCSMDELGLQSAKSQNMFERTGNEQMKESKSLILGDILTFLEDYINRIIEKIDDRYTLEFVGYETTDLKTQADIDKAEIEGYKTLNEKREEKGMSKLEAEWANIPMNVQAVQLYQSDQANQQMAGEGGEGESEGEESDDSWMNYGNDMMGDGGGSSENAGPENENQEEEPEEDNMETE
jgi:hypothetical protein